MVQRGVLERIKENSLRGSRRKFNLHSQICARRRIKIRHRSAHARRTHRQNGKETKACPGFCSKRNSFKNNREKPRFFQKGLRQDFLCKLSYKRRFNQKQTH